MNNPRSTADMKSEKRMPQVSGARLITKDSENCSEDEDDPSQSTADVPLHRSTSHDGRDKSPIFNGESELAATLLSLLTCPLCAQPLDPARTLPCGNTVCDRCWDSMQIAGSSRQCPFEDCVKGRHRANLANDVTLRKLWAVVRAGLHAEATEHNQNSEFQWSGLQVLFEEVCEGRVSLRNQQKAVFSNTLDESQTSNTAINDPLLGAISHNLLQELDCQICYSAFYDPIVSACGHSFCRTCLLRSIDHSPHCPTCRNLIPPPYVDLCDAPGSKILKHLFYTFWPGTYNERKQVTKAEELSMNDIFDSLESLDITRGATMPIFVCTLSFPYMPTFLHVFEPRYKLMIRRCMDSDRRFGICLPKDGDEEIFEGEDAACPTAQYGTVLRIWNVQFLEDGRSLVETHGEERFKLYRWGIRDGYMVGHVELLADDGTNGDAENDEEQDESSLLSATALGFDLSHDGSDLSVPDLLEEATHFINQLRTGSAPWLLQRVELTHGEVPRDPTVFAFWVASLIPVDEEQKYLLLKARGVRTRLRIVIHWIRKLQTQWWFNGGCLIM